MLDVQNQYEGEAVSFQNKVELQLEHFREVSAKTHQLTVIIQSRPITTFYTGGFPCEKVARAFLGQRFQSIYLDYLPRCERD